MLGWRVLGGGVESLQFCEPGEIALSNCEDFVLEESKSFLCEKLDGSFSLFEDLFLHFVLCLLDVVIPDLYIFLGLGILLHVLREGKLHL